MKSLARVSKLKAIPKLFESPNPLEQKLGADFFQNVPRSPGVYFFENRKGNVLYVGKTKNLSRRLQAYRGAPTLEVPVKTRKLLFSTESIRWEPCPTTAEAQQKENVAVRLNKPPFNVVKTRTEKFPFVQLKYKAHNKRLQFKLVRDPSTLPEDDEAQIFGAFQKRGELRKAYAALLRVLWYSAEFEKKNGDFDNAPALLFRIDPPREYQIRCETRRLSQVQAYWSGIRGLTLLQELSDMLLKKLPVGTFHHEVLLQDFQNLLDFYQRTLSYNRRLSRFHKMGQTAVPQDKIDDVTFLQKFTVARKALAKK